MVTYIPVSQAKETNLIPEPWHSYFSDTCGYCDEPMMISTSRTIYRCTNPYCRRRVAGMIAALLQDVGVKGFGRQLAYNYLRNTGIASVAEFIYSPPPELRGLAELISQQNYTYARLIKVMHFPRLGTKGDLIFSNCNNWSDFIAKCNNAGGMLPYISRCVGGDEMPYIIKDILDCYWKEMELITELVTVVPASRHIIKIAMTGEVTRVKDEFGHRVTKDKFIMLLNNHVRVAGVSFELSTALESVPFIVGDMPSQTTKYLVGLRRGNLITSDALLAACQDIIENHFMDIVQETQQAELGITSKEIIDNSEKTNLFGGTSNE